MKLDDEPSLNLNIRYDTKSGLFLAKLDNGTRFNFSPNNVSGKLGTNLDLLKAFTTRNNKGEPPHPHVTVADKDAALIEEAIAAGKLQKVGVANTPLFLDLIGD